MTMDDAPSCSPSRTERRGWCAIFSPAEQALNATTAAASAAAAAAASAAGSAGAASAPRPERREESGGGGSERPMASSAAAAASPPQPPGGKEQHEEDIWESSKPVERRSQALTDELHDCLGLFWSWVTCGGPGARVRQLYVNGRLSRCADEWARLRTCAAIRASAAGGGFLFGGGERGGGSGGGEVDVVVNPGPHPVWRIRSRKEARAFWADNYAHLGAGAVSGGGGAGGGGGGGRAAAPSAAGGAREEAAPAVKEDAGGSADR